MAEERTLKLVKPVFVTIPHPEDESKLFREDVFVVRRLLQKAEKQPNEQERWSLVLDWLAEKWVVDRKSLSENIAVHLNNQILDIVVDMNKEIANQDFTNASLADSTGETPKTG